MRVAHAARRDRVMDIFEWLGESANPGPIGSVDVGGADRSDRTRAMVIVSFLVALGALAGWAYLIVVVFEVRSAWALTGIGIGTLAYLVLGYFVHAKPNTSNLGWMGGTMNNPFRYSDDINRFLLTVLVVLMPGRFIAEAAVDMVQLVRHARG
jgi:hypothetical protein